VHLFCPTNNTGTVDHMAGNTPMSLCIPMPDCAIGNRSMTSLPRASTARRGAAIAMPLLSVSAAAQMITPGEFSVSAGGAASYEIKLRATHGVAGLVPNLSLVYNSQGANGLLGVGWTLSGLSTIARCPQNRAQDAVPRFGGISFTAHDHYCLDGQRLVAVRNPADTAATVDAYGASGTYYATEMESFSKVQSLGSVGTSADWNGQPYWLNQREASEFSHSRAYVDQNVSDTLMDFQINSQ
jgi:hypothetical protein